ncbi:MAG: TraR/DksA family transcriptional regulator [Candidatus Eisenbacteria bacterium]
MDANTTLRIRQRLLDELGQRGRLLGQMKKSATERSQAYLEEGGAFASHMAEAATEEADRESDYLMVDAQGRLLNEIEEAIRRIDEGIYGLCEWCGKPIAERRLEVLPYARFCLKCQEKAEKAQNN